MIEKLKISLKSTIKSALKTMAKAGEKCLIVVEDDNSTLLGTLSDGDLRKFILKGGKLTKSIDGMYNPEPTFFVKKKYTINDAKNTIHHYEQIVRQRVEATGTTDAIPVAKIEVDETTYNALASADRDIVYCYNWELDRNEAKRDIKLIDAMYVGDIMSEHAEKLG